MSERTRVAIVGLGFAGELLHGPAVRALPDLFEIVAACDVDEQRRIKLASAWGATPLQSFSKVIADQRVDLVVIATKPYEAHVDQAIAALAAGKHVVVEKPVALTLNDALRLKDAVARAPRSMLFPHHNQRWNVAYQCFREAVETGVVGELKYLELRKNTSATGGDMFFDIGSHWVDMLVGLVSRRSLTEVSAIVCNPGGFPHELGFFSATLRYADGLMAEVRLLPDSETRDVQHWYAAGSKGGYHQQWFDNPQDLFRKQSRQTTTEQNRHVPARFALIDLQNGGQIVQENRSIVFYREVAHAIRGERGRHLVDINAVVEQLIIMEAIIESAKTGKTVMIPPQG